jgi:Ca2+/Na+ antiporter
LVVIAVAISQKNPSLALGNLIGSCIANILASFSLGLLFAKNVSFDRSSKIYAAVLLALTSLFLIILFTLKASFKWIAGGFLLCAFLVYVASVASLIYKGTLTAPEDDSDDDSDSDDSSDDDDDFEERKAPSGPTPESDSDEEAPSRKKAGLRRSHSSSISRGSSERTLIPSRKAGKPAKKFIVMTPRTAKPRKPLYSHFLRLFLGLSALLVSSYIIAHSASSIGRDFSLSGTVVGTTILSLATTLPEKFVAVMGGVRRQPGIMVANTVGSNIFLVTLCAGVLFLWGDAQAIEQGFTIFEACTMWLSAAVIMLIVLFGGKRWMGIVMLCLYSGFLAMEFYNGRKLDDD